MQADDTVVCDSCVPATTHTRYSVRVHSAFLELERQARAAYADQPVATVRGLLDLKRLIADLHTLAVAAARVERDDEDDEAWFQLRNAIESLGVTPDAEEMDGATYITLVDSSS